MNNSGAAESASTATSGSSSPAFLAASVASCTVDFISSTILFTASFWSSAVMPNCANVAASFTSYSWATCSFIAS